jgi:hypothetical protein
VALVMARNATEADFRFVPPKVCFLFSSAKIEFFCEVATETANGKLGTTTHINNRPSGIHISALISKCKPSEVSFDFAKAPANFVGSDPQIGHN